MVKDLRKKQCCAPVCMAQPVWLSRHIAALTVSYLAAHLQWHSRSARRRFCGLAAASVDVRENSAGVAFLRLRAVCPLFCRGVDAALFRLHPGLRKLCAVDEASAVADERPAGPWGFGPVLLMRELAKDHALLLPPTQPCHLWHPCRHRRLRDAWRLLAAAYVSPLWLRFMLCESVRRQGPNDKKGRLAVGFHMSVVEAMGPQARGTSTAPEWPIVPAIGRNAVYSPPRVGVLHRSPRCRAHKVGTRGTRGPGDSTSVTPRSWPLCRPWRCSSSHFAWCSCCGR